MYNFFFKLDNTLCLEALPDLEPSVVEVERSIRIQVMNMSSLQCAAEEECLASSASLGIVLAPVLLCTVRIGNYVVSG